MKYLCRFTLSAWALAWVACGAVVAEDGPPVPPTPSALVCDGGEDANGFGAPWTVEPPPKQQLNAVAGFAYIRPAWGTQQFTLSVPNGGGGGGALLADPRDVLHDYNFAPRVDVDYYFNVPGIGLRASGQAVNLSGNLDQTVTSPAGAAQLHAHSTLGLAAVNLPEMAAVLHCPDPRHPRPENSWSDGFVGKVSLGTRYSSLSQTFDALVMSGPNTASLHSDQSFTGFGVTGAVEGQYPLASKLAVYSSVRGSALFGTNNRSSSFMVMAPAAPAASTSAALTDRKGTVVPVGELDVGLAWGNEVGKAYAEDPAKLVYLAVGFTGQIWGNTALISAANSPRISNDTLYLLGLTLTLGFSY